MPTQQQVNNLILSAGWVAATLTEQNRENMNSGLGRVKWDRIKNINRYLIAVQRQFNLGDYTSPNFLAVYSCLYSQIGLDTTVNSINPNFYPPQGIIIVPNPPNALQPTVLGYNDFDPASTQVINGITVRTVYSNAAWKGVNPFMVVSQPLSINLFLVTDYTLISSGGFTLLPTSPTLPGITLGQTIVVTGYASA